MATIKKDDVVNALAKEKNISKLEARDRLDFILEFISQSLSEGKDVDLYNFGKFEVKTRAARNGHNPATGEKIRIAEKKAVHFASKKALTTRL